MDLLLTAAAAASHLEDAARLVLAGICAGCIGWDREARGRPAGLRTHMLVALGAATFVLLGERLAAEAVAQGADAIRFDPGRIVAAIVGGIGFLGAGAIIHSGGNVRGLTTAAGMWLTAAIGVAFGMGAYVLGLSVTALGFVVVSWLRTMEHKPPPADGGPSGPD